MARNTAKGEYVLKGSDVPKIQHIRSDFLTDLPKNRSRTAFTKIDASAGRTIKRLLLDRVVSLDNQDVILTAKYADCKWPNSGYVDIVRLHAH